MNNINFSVVTTIDESLDMCNALFQENNLHGFAQIKTRSRKEKTNSKIFDIYHGASLDHAINLARKNKSSVAFNLDEENQLINLAVKHQRRFKYLTAPEVSILFFNYYLAKKLRQSENLENSVVVVSTLTSSLVKKIAERQKIQIETYDGDFTKIQEQLELKKDKKVLFALNELGHFTYDGFNKTLQDKIFNILEMIAYYKNTNDQDLYLKEQSIYSEYGIHRNRISFRAATEDASNRLINRLENIKDFGTNTIVDKVSVDNNSIIKFTTKSGNHFGLKKMKDKILIVTETIGNVGEELMDIITFEREVDDLITDNIETFALKKFSWKTVIKYFIFVLIAVGIMAFIFNLIYEEASGYNLWEQSKLIFYNEKRIIWTFVWFGHIFGLLLGTWKRYRMMKFQKAKIKFHQMLIGNIMGGIIGFLTPMTIGGDAIVYWYLRRKGVERGALIASLMSSTVIYQATIVIQTLVLLPFGAGIYIDVFKMLFEENAIVASSVLIMYIVGLAWNLFATFMILTLVMWRRFQEWIIKYSIIFLEWFRFTKVYDVGSKYAKVQYEFREMRRGAKMLWSSPIFLLENLFYLLLPFFFSPVTLMLMFQSDFYRTDFSKLKLYFANMVIYDIRATSNSLSLTPGGSGTAEWLAKVLGPYLMNPEFGHEYIPGLTSVQATSSVDFIWKLIMSWPWLIISGGTVLTIIEGETHLEKINEHNKNVQLTKVGVMKKNYYYKISCTIWFSLIISFMIFVSVI